MGIAQEWAARSLESVLAPAGFAVVRAYTGMQALDLVEVAAPDVIVIDSRLPDMDGVDVIQRLRDERRAGEHVPVVLTTSGPAPRDLLVSAFSLGAWTVWEQPIDAELMLYRLGTWVQAKRAVDAAEQANVIEPDTGMYTARGLERRARELVADANRRRTPVSCVAITPVIAPRAGQPQELPSAAVTSAVVSLLQQIARGSDVMGRSGAQEFAILAPTTTAAGARALVERLRDCRCRDRVRGRGGGAGSR
jgi:two-component system, cell cycle response regulator